MFFYMNGHVDRPGPDWTQCRGVIARTSFFVLYSVFKERRPGKSKPPGCSVGHSPPPELLVGAVGATVPRGRSHLRVLPGAKGDTTHVLARRQPEIKEIR